MKLPLIIATALSVLILSTTSVDAEVPHLIRFQGKATDKSGAPLSGRYDITFRVYDRETGGSLLWSETQPEIPVYNGIFTVLLGEINSLDLPFDQPYWLSMELNNDGEMLPRQRITSVGYAYYAEKAKTVEVSPVIPQGSVILWLGSSCPDGYSRVSALDGKFIVGGASYNSTAGGSNTHSHGAGTYMGPSHTHDIGHGHGANYGYVAGAGSGSFDKVTSIQAMSGNSGSGGNSPMTGTSSSADSRPEFATVLFCRKD